MIIQPAEPRDIEAMMGNFSEYCLTFNFEDFGLTASPQNWGAMILNQILNDDNFICNVLKNDAGKILGQCAFEITRNWFNPGQEIATQRMLYLNQESRKGTSWKALLDRTILDVKEQGVRVITFPVVQNNTGALERYLKKTGFEEVEKHYILKKG